MPARYRAALSDRCRCKTGPSADRPQRFSPAARIPREVRAVDIRMKNQAIHRSFPVAINVLDYMRDQHIQRTNISLNLFDIRDPLGKATLEQSRA